MSSDARNARIGGRLADGGRQGPRFRSVQVCAAVTPETGRPVRREPARAVRGRVGGRVGGRAGGRGAGRRAGAAAVPVTRITVRAPRVPAVAPPACGGRRRGVRLTRRGRIVLTCGWTMIAAMALWITVLLTG